MQQNSNQEQNKQVHHSLQEIDYIRLLRIFLSRWYWILGAVLIGMFIAYINLRFTPSTYQSSALLKFDDKKNRDFGVNQY